MCVNEVDSPGAVCTGEVVQRAWTGGAVRDGGWRRL